MYKTKHYMIQELVSQDLYSMMMRTRKSDWILWGLFDDRALMTLDNLKDYLEMLLDKKVPVTVNSWPFVDVNSTHQRGYRQAHSEVGAQWSPHKTGSAFDATAKGIEAKDIRKNILKMSFEERKKHGLHYIKRIETGCTWFHFDLMNFGKDNEISLFVKK